MLSLRPFTMSLPPQLAPLLRQLAPVLKTYLSPEGLKTLFTRSSADPGRERYRRAGMTASTSYMAKGLTLVMGFVSVPLTVHYLGAERYGVWLTISSLLLWVVRGTTLLGSRVYWFKYAGGVTVSGHRTTSDRPTPACPSGRAPSRTGRTTSS